MTLIKQKNICIISHSLAKGGAERVAAQQSIILHQLGYQVFIVTVLNEIEFDYQGTLLNLGILKDEKDGLLHRVSRLIRLQKFLKKNKIDVIIDHRSRNNLARELGLQWLIYRKIKSIFIIHSFNLEKSFPNQKKWAKILYSNHHLVCVSKAIEQNIIQTFGFKHTHTIYNPIHLERFSNIPNKKPHSPFILFFGRFDEHAKDLRFLIHAYHKSELPKQNIALYLMGEGPDKNKIEKFVAQLHLTDKVIFKPYNPSPFTIVKQALFTVLTSHYEGFPMSIVESLACSTPVVSVDCESGPRELIQHKHNGLLVTKELSTYTEALNLMILEPKILNHCQQNCVTSIQYLSTEYIANKWQTLIDHL